MYSNRWTPGLRQGDVVGPIIYPKLKGPPQINHRPQGWGDDRKVNLSLEQPAYERYAVVASHDCEFNDGKRALFLMARLDDLNRDVKQEQVEAIRAANDAIRIEEKEEGEDEAPPRYDYIDTFVFDPVAGAFDTEKLVRFTTLTAWPEDMLDYVISLKRAELEHEYRVRFQRKLAFFLGREADDEPDENKFDAPAAS